MRVKQLSFQEKVDWIQKQCAALKVPWEDGHIRVNVRRDLIGEDTVTCLSNMEFEEIIISSIFFAREGDLKKIWRFEFVGEPAIDAGGVAREFFTLSTEALFNPDLGLFLYSSGQFMKFQFQFPSFNIVNQTNLQFNPDSGIANADHLTYYYTAGRLMGKALFEGQLVTAHLTPNLYKQLLGLNDDSLFHFLHLPSLFIFIAWPISFSDLEQIDFETYSNLIKLVDMDQDEVIFLFVCWLNNWFGLVCLVGDALSRLHHH